MESQLESTLVGLDLSQKLGKMRQPYLGAERDEIAGELHRPLASLALRHVGAAGLAPRPVRCPLTHKFTECPCTGISA